MSNSVDRGSQAAARELGLTPAMVGRHIQGLKDRLGTRLLNRTTARQSLTEAGAALYVRANAILEQLEKADTVASDRQAEPGAPVDLHVHAVHPSARHLPPKVRSFVDFPAGRYRDPPPWDQEAT